MRRLRSSALLTLVFALTLILSACGTRGPEFVDGGASYDTTSAAALTQVVDTSNLAGTPSSRAADLRHEALTALRARGGRAVPVADLLTRTFPAETRGVPVYFERAVFKGKPVVIVVEAIGPEQGKLSAKRVWVLDEKGEVLFVGGR